MYRVRQKKPLAKSQYFIQNLKFCLSLLRVSKRDILRSMPKSLSKNKYWFQRYKSFTKKEKKSNLTKLAFEHPCIIPKVDSKKETILHCRMPLYYLYDPNECTWWYCNIIQQQNSFWMFASSAHEFWCVSICSSWSEFAIVREQLEGRYLKS